jgi:hypothetical protein
MNLNPSLILPRNLAILIAAAGLICGASQSRATIDVTLQMQLGNASGAVVDPNNHQHYLIQRAQYALDYSDTIGGPNWVSWDFTSSDDGTTPRGNYTTDNSLPSTFYHVKTGGIRPRAHVPLGRSHRQRNR